jgi:hypothetical protein
MNDLFQLILGILASRFKSRAKLEAENLILRQQVNVVASENSVYLTRGHQRIRK